MIVDGSSHPYIDDIMDRPVYSLRGYVYKNGNGSYDGDITGAGADFELRENDFFAFGNVLRAETNGEIPVGNVVSEYCSLSLRAQEFNVEDFENAVIFLIIRARTRTDEILNIKAKTFFITDAKIENSKIVIEGNDAAFKLNIKYECGIAEYSEDLTLHDVFADAVSQSGLRTLSAPATTPNSAYLTSYAEEQLSAQLSKTIYKRLRSGKFTCAQICAYLAFRCCANVVIDNEYVDMNPAAYKYSPPDELITYIQHGHELKRWVSLEYDAETIHITGLRCIVDTNNNGDKIDPIELYSTDYSDEYAIDVSGNPFMIRSSITDGYSLVFLDWVFFKFVKFKKFRGKHIAYPLASCGDYVSIVSLQGEFDSYILEYEWEINGAIDLGCNIDSAADNSTEYPYSNTTSSSTIAAATITKAGTTDDWEYRRWSNGVAECWGTVDVSSLACATSVGGWYRTAPITLPSYPFIYSRPPCLNIGFETDSGTGALAWSAGTANDADATKQPHQIYLIRMSSSNSVSGRISIHVIGDATDAD